MAEIIEGGGGHEKGGKKRPKKSPVRMDMTPMVDLAFLLLTFFILATSLSKPKTLEIVYPKDVENPEIEGVEDITEEINKSLDMFKRFKKFN